MAIRRTPRPPKLKTIRPPKEVTTSCASCNRPLAEKDTKFVMPSLLDPTELACSKPCYDRWVEKGQPPASTA